MTAYSGTCLCGAISFSYAARPAHLTRCNCTACRKLNPLWAHGRTDIITIEENGPAIRYVRPDGDGDLAFVSCATCGCTTHWEPVAGKYDQDRRAVNMALVDPAQIADLPVRHFDGADSWAFLD